MPDNLLPKKYFISFRFLLPAILMLFLFLTRSEGLYEIADTAGGAVNRVFQEVFHQLKGNFDFVRSEGIYLFVTVFSMQEATYLNRILRKIKQ
ncbi:MAG: hypothetical protein D3903_16590 [Candidatus Electrothrix sp. GM3_4]|nr:hypothetical protein [Candidatus Electrothrix sp. GM3_4]